MTEWEKYKLGFILDLVLMEGEKLLRGFGGDGPRCVTVCLRPLAMLDEDDEDRVDEQALQQLTEMGFPESRAIKALRLNQ